MFRSVAKSFLFAAVSCVAALSTHLDACTGIKLIAKDGSFVHGRTLEFGVEVQSTIALVPRKYAFTGTAPDGKGLEYKAKYAAVGCFSFDIPAMMDGLNEKGLAIGSFYFPGFAGYTAITAENQPKALSPVDFPNWILTQFATVDEVKAGLASVVIAPTVVKEWGETPVPLHYIVFDKEGNGLVIEPIAGKLVVYDNPIGTFTNSPTFDWHMANLRNYINLTPFNVKPLTVQGMTLAPFGQGSGMVGLPGDFTPPSRFVRSAIYAITAIPSATAKDSVMQAFHLLNQFDIPVGSARSVVKGITYSDMTQITCVRDPQALQYYFRTYDDQNIKMVDLKKFDWDAKEIVQLPTTGTQPVVDMSPGVTR